eukprot:m.354359 g.354359  ORF g.354359 m.354359 type:complete len:132 (+) comp16988_c0_seq1:154-549(+)
MSQQDFKDAFFVFGGAKGSLSQVECGQCIRGLGFSITDDALRSKVGASVDLNGFLAVVNGLSSPTDADNTALQDSLAVFDKYNNGTIPAKEFAHMVTILGDRFTEAEAAEVMKFSQDGRIDHEAMHKKLIA